MTNSLPSPFLDSGAITVNGPDEAAVSLRPVEDAAVEYDCLMDDIGEIFAGATRLDELDDPYLFELDPGNQKYRGMPKPRLHVARFMQELDEPPLFLQQARA
jgi:hypothetical protein